MIDWPQALARARTALMRRGRTKHDAEDIAQDAWIRLSCHESQEDVDRPEAYLMRTALNLSIDAHRAGATRGEAVAVDEVVLIDTAPTPEAVLLARERLSRLGSCLLRLSGPSRDMLLAHRVNGMTYQQIADQHGLSVSSVERHIASATLRLTTWMEGW